MQNHGVTIYLSNNDKTDLKKILEIVGNVGIQSIWAITNAECLGEFAEDIHRVSENKKLISGQEFYNLASGVYQTLGGDFKAFKKDGGSHWLLIRSIRGDEFDVETQDNDLLNKIRNEFNDVKDLIY